MHPPKKHSGTAGVIALVIEASQPIPALIEAISDDEEISLFESALKEKDLNPLSILYEFRERKQSEEEEFGDYVEALLTQSFIPPDVQKHGMAWFQSKLKIEEFKKSEAEATQIISEYAFKVFLENTERREFMLSGPKAKVCIKIFLIKTVFQKGSSAA
jgi:hypothetical protein